MTDYERGYIRRWQESTPETRSASKRHWLDIYQAAITGTNTSLRELAEKTLALQVLVESGWTFED